MVLTYIRQVAICLLSDKKIGKCLTFDSVCNWSDDLTRILGRYGEISWLRSFGLQEMERKENRGGRNKCSGVPGKRRVLFILSLMLVCILPCSTV